MKKSNKNKSIGRDRIKSVAKSEPKRDVELYLYELYSDFNPGVTLDEYRNFADWIIWTYIHEMHERYRLRVIDAVNYKQQPPEFPNNPNDN